MNVQTRKRTRWSGLPNGIALARSINLKRKRSRFKKVSEYPTLSKIKPWERYKLQVHKDGGIHNLIDQFDTAPYEDQELDLGLEFNIDFNEFESEDSEFGEEFKLESDENELDLNKVLHVV